MFDQKPTNPRRLYIRLTSIPAGATEAEAFEIIKAAEASTRLELEQAEDNEANRSGNQGEGAK